MTQIEATAILLEDNAGGLFIVDPTHRGYDMTGVTDQGSAKADLLAFASQDTENWTTPEVQLTEKDLDNMNQILSIVNGQLLLHEKGWGSAARKYIEDIHGESCPIIGCWNPLCVDPEEVREDYPAHCAHHGQYPPHINGILESKCDFYFQGDIIVIDDGHLKWIGNLDQFNEWMQFRNIEPTETHHSGGKILPLLKGADNEMEPGSYHDLCQHLDEIAGPNTGKSVESQIEHSSDMNRRIHAVFPCCGEFIIDRYL